MKIVLYDDDDTQSVVYDADSFIEVVRSFLLGECQHRGISFPAMVADFYMTYRQGLIRKGRGRETW